MIIKVKKDFKDQLSVDLNEKPLSNGKKLGGSVSGDRIRLYTVDNYGKHSSFMTRVFYGKLIGDELSGRFSISLYAALLLGVLLGFCVESIVSAIITNAFEAMIFPICIIITELIYFISLKRISAENDRLIKKYIEDFTVED